MGGHGARRKARERRHKIAELEAAAKDADERLKKASDAALPAPSTGQQVSSIDQLPAA